MLKNLTNPVQIACSLLESLSLPPTPTTLRSLPLTPLPHLPTHQLSVLTFGSVPSTMLLAQHWPADLLSATCSWCFLADQQSVGQGQHSNTWSSPPGNIYLTILTMLSEMDLKGLSMAVALSVCQLVPEGKIKWPNDVYVGDRKLSGCLVRTQGAEGEEVRVEIGVGVNVKVAPLEGVATCLEKVWGKELDLKDITDKLIRQLMNNLEIIKNQGYGIFKEQINNKIMLIGEKVNIFDIQVKEVKQKGVFLGMTEEFYAQIKEENGKTVFITDGRMRKA